MSPRVTVVDGRPGIGVSLIKVEIYPFIGHRVIRGHAGRHGKICSLEYVLYTVLRALPDLASRLEPVSEDAREFGVVPFEHNSRGGVDSVSEAVNAADVSDEALERARRRADDVGVDVE